VIASTAAARESTIFPGVGIGKVKLGMTKAQVVRALGKHYIVNDRFTVHGKTYVEYAWNFAQWTVRFSTRPSYRVVQVATTAKTQRTPRGVGAGSRWLKVVHGSPGGLCTFWQTLEYLAPHKGGTQTIYQLKGWSADPSQQEIDTWRVTQVIVRTAYQPLHEFAPDYKMRCKDGWQSTPKPQPRSDRP
jgi:hypothetical protein